MEIAKATEKIEVSSYPPLQILIGVLSAHVQGIP